jgi:diguanylate cyclase (GGDEF)-like protein/PAS domain S-box-containing protein
MGKHPLLAMLLLLMASASGEAAPALEHVTLQLKWTHQFQFAGYYAALDQGYYSEAGLDVTILEGRPDLDPVAEVVNGRADFGIGASELVVARASGKPVVALAVILQHSPLVLLARSGPRVISLKSLVGKEIRVVPHEYELNALFHGKGYSPSDFRLVPRTPHDIDDLLAGRLAAFSGYSTVEPFLLDQFGADYIQVSPHSAGIDFYGDTLFTSEERLKAKARVVAAFREASLRGWKYAMEHPRELVELIIARYPSAKQHDHLLFEARQMRVLMLPDVIEIGYMNEERWRNIANTYADLGMMKRDTPLAGFIYNPNPQRDYTWLYLSTITGFGAALLVGAIGLYIYNINRKLRVSENYHRQLIDNSPFPVLVTRLKDDTLTYINNRVETLFDVKRTDVIGHKVDKFWVDKTRREAMFNLLRKHGSVSDFETELMTGEDKRLWSYLSAVITEFNGEPSLLVAFNDITERKQMEEALRKSEQRYRMLAENAMDVIWTFDVSRRTFSYISAAVKRMRGYTVEEAMQQTIDEALTPESARQAREELAHLVQSGELTQCTWEMEQPCKDGSTIWTDVTLTLIRDAGGNPVEIMGITRDITEQHRLSEALKARLVAIEAAAESFMITDKNGIIEYVNPAFTEMTGFTAEEAIGKKPNIVKSELHPPEFYQELWATITAGHIWRGEITNRDHNGRIYIDSTAIAPVMNEQGEIIRYVAIKHDVTERREMESRLEHMAHFDMLTGVPNRQLFLERLEQSISLARRHQERLALLFIDLDGFKEINDNLGHEAGDAVLREIALRLHSEIRESDTVARVGGDEFVVLINTLQSSDNLEGIVRKLLEGITLPILLSGELHVIGASIGVSLFPEHGHDVASLLSNADSAMYMSKRTGKNRWTLYAAV